MRRGRTPWWTKVSAAFRRKIDAALDGGEKPREVYDRCNLQRCVRFDTFRRYARIRLRDRQQRRELQPSPSESLSEAVSMPDADADEILDAALAAMSDALEAGRVKSYVLPSFVRSMLDLRLIKVKESADRRAAELHQQKMQQAAEKLQTVAVSNRLTPEQVAEIREKVLGL